MYGALLLNSVNYLLLLSVIGIYLIHGSWTIHFVHAGQVGWSGIKHLSSNKFDDVIKKAQETPGFAADEPEKTIMGGFGRNTILSVADKVLSAVQAGSLKRIFLIGGCDGSEGERNYYKELAVALPKDTAILTMGCGKYRFNKLDLGTLPGLNIPRVLDMGQCNGE